MKSFLMAEILTAWDLNCLRWNSLRCEGGACSGEHRFATLERLSATAGLPFQPGGWSFTLLPSWSDRETGVLSIEENLIAL